MFFFDQLYRFISFFSHPFRFSLFAAYTLSHASKCRIYRLWDSSYKSVLCLSSQSCSLCHLMRTLFRNYKTIRKFSEIENYFRGIIIFVQQGTTISLPYTDGGREEGARNPPTLKFFRTKRNYFIFLLLLHQESSEVTLKYLKKSDKCTKIWVFIDTDYEYRILLCIWLHSKR